MSWSFIYQLTFAAARIQLFVLANATVPSRFPAALSGHAPLEAAFLPVLTRMFSTRHRATFWANMLFL